MNSIVKIILMITLAYGIQNACLSKAGLESIGFTDALEAAVANTGDEAVCKNFENVCVDPAKLKANIQQILEGFKGDVKKTFASTKNIVKVINKSMFKLKQRYEDEKKKAKLEEKLSAEVLASIVEMFKKCTETECDIFGTSLDDPSTHKTCFKGIVTLISKALCLIASDQGSTDGTLDSTGNLVSMAVLQAEADGVFDVCVTYFGKQCEIVNSSEAFYQTSKGKKQSLESKTKRLSEACVKFADIAACSTDTSSCSEAIKSQFFEAFVSFGSDSSPGLKSDTIDGVQTTAEESDSSDSDPEPSGGRILEATSTCSFTVSSSATSLSGVESGIDAEEYAGTMIWNLSIITLIVTLLK
jgi:hypothetical protein